MHQDRMPYQPEHFARRMLMTVGMTALIIILLLSLWYAANVFLLIFAGILLAIFLRGLSDKVSEHTPLSGKWSLALVGFALIAIVAAAFWLLAPNVAAQVNQLTESVPRALARIQQNLGQYPWVQSAIARAPSIQQLLPDPADIFGRITGLFSSTLSVLANTVVVLFIGIYVAVDPGLYRRGVVRLVPLHKRARADEVLQALSHTLWSWLITRLFSMAVVGVLTSLGLWLLGIPLVLTLGLTAALLTFIPTIGPIISAVPAVLLGMLQGPTEAVYVIVLYLAIQTVESYFIPPLVQQRALSMPPALVISALILLGVLLGFLGLMLATPLAAAALILVQMLYIEDVLGDSDVA